MIRSLLDELNETLKELFDYFKETDENEFEAFETKIIPTKSLKSDVMKLILGSQEIIFDPIRNGYYQGESQVLSMETKFDSFWFTMKMNPGRDIYLAGINELLSFKQYDFLKHEHYCKLLERFRISAPEEVKKGLDWHDLNEWINSEINNANESPLGQTLPPQPIVKQKPIKYGANEYALTYIFDLYGIGQQVPINRIEGSFDAKKIKQDASKFPYYDKEPDTFYRAVKSVLKYDLNNPTDLQNISKDWLNAVSNLSTNWVTTEQYLKDKELIGE